MYGLTNIPATSVTQSDTTCAKIVSLEVYNPTTKLWGDYNTDASKTTKWPYIQNYNSVTAVFDIKFSTDLGPTYDATQVTLRIKTTDVFSGQPTGTIYDQWTISFVYVCALDNLSITSLATNIQDQAYTFAASALTFPTPAITHTVVGCATTFKIYAYSTVLNIWRDKADADNPLPFISAFSTASGSASVSYSGSGTDAILTGQTWKPKTVLKMKIVATSTYSKTTGQTVTDDFLLTMSDNCATNKIALDGTTYSNANAGTSISDFSYLIGSTAITKLPIISAVQPNSSCPIVAKLYVFDPAANKWIDQTTPSAPYNAWISSFTGTSGQLVINQA